MKVEFRLSLYLLVILLGTDPDVLQAQFQPAPVEVSTQKAVYQGKIYLIHTVKAGQTLHSICKAYGVTEKEVRLSNPEVDLTPLAIGTALRIPYRQETPVSAINTQESGEEDFIFHTVRAGETAYFLHKKYGVPLEAIYRYNPGTEQGLQIGQVVRIPRSQFLQVQSEQTDAHQPEIQHYLVKPGDTLYRIAQIYGVSVADLINANEALRWGLKAGETIRIPEPGTLYLPVAQFPDSVMLVTRISAMSESQCDSLYANKKQHPPVKIAVLLPFFVEENFLWDTLISKIDSLSPRQLDIKDKAMQGRGAMEFYEGLLLAVDSLRKSQIDMSLFVYDTKGDTVRTKQILKELTIVEPDLIVGPFFSKNVELVSKYSFERKIPLASPLAKADSSVGANPYFFQVVPGEQAEMVQYARYLSQFHKKNLILVYKNDLKNKGDVDLFKKVLVNHIRLKPDFDSLLFTEVHINDSLTQKLSRALSDSSENYVIVYSSYEPDVINTITQLHFALREKSIRVFGMPAWQVFPNVRMDHYHDLEATLYSPFFINYYSDPVKRFLAVSRSELGYEPYKTSSRGNGINFTFLGYDVAFQFIRATYQYGDNLCDCISHFQPELLLSEYFFTRESSEGGFENQTISIVNYTRNYEILREGYVNE